MSTRRQIRTAGSAYTTVLVMLIVCLTAMGQGKSGKGGGGGGEEPPAVDPVIAATVDGSYRKGGDLALLDAGGTTLSILLNAPTGVAYQNPSWDPSGEWILFTEGSTNSLAVVSLKVVKKDGSELYEVWTPTVNGFGSASWSPDGAWIAYSGWDVGDWDDLGDDVAETYLIPVSSIGPGGFGTPHVISSLSASNPFASTYPSWSHLGDKLAVASRRPEDWDSSDIVVFAIEYADSNLCDPSFGQSVAPCVGADQNVSLTFGLPLYLPTAVWAKDHDWLAVGAGGYLGIYLVDLEGSCGGGTGRVADGGSVTWSTDDTEIAFGGRDRRKFRLYGQEVWNGQQGVCPQGNNDPFVIKDNLRFLGLDWQR